MACEKCGTSKCTCKIIDRRGLRGPQGPRGPEGPQGPAGTNASGHNAFTILTANFTQPNIGSNVTIAVSTAGSNTGDWASLNQIIFIQTGGYYQVVTPGTSSIVVKNLGYTGNASPGATIVSNNLVSPGGLKGLDAAAPAIIADNYGPFPYVDVTGAGFKKDIYTIPPGGAGTYSVIVTANIVADAPGQNVSFEYSIDAGGPVLQGNITNPTAENLGAQAIVTHQCPGLTLTPGQVIYVKVKSTGTNAKSKLINWHVFKTS